MLLLCRFFPSTYKNPPKYLVQFDMGHVVSNWGCQEIKGSPLTFNEFHVCFVGKDLKMRSTVAEAEKLAAGRSPI